jgi:hypothetical protein
MQDHDLQSSRLTRRRLLGGIGVGSLALISSPALAQPTVIYAFRAVRVRG